MVERLTAASILLATITWLLSYVHDRSARKIAHTADALASLSTSERLAESSFQVTRIINSGATVSMEGLDPRLESHVVDILDYYEFLCDLYANNALNRKTIAMVRGRLMKKTWEACEPYIRETRALQGRPVYEGFERFVEQLRIES
jgi:hypothetical protein